jgi:nicotinamidase-related amidase/type 1 glutamine amidotransferase
MPTFFHLKFPRSTMHVALTLVAAIASMATVSTTVRGEALKMQLRYQTETAPGSGRYHTLLREEGWNPAETAIIVCDMWDLHHCLNAVRRVGELAPRINQVLTQARSDGAVIIHAPSDCMATYEQHPARRRAMDVPAVQEYPAEITTWCSVIPEESRGKYPIDQSDGGEDDDLIEHAEWAAQLAAMGRNPRAPWKSQHAAITIDGQHDYITDRGDEVWNILEARGVRQIVLLGVHTNMCVLGRPFGLRQMARNGKHVVLMRDLTDTMYNPKQWPYVSHFTGTDLIIDHIERFVCPTITSDQWIGGKPLTFAGDRRPHVALLIAEDEYQTEETLPTFAAQQLGDNFRVSYIYGDAKERNSLPGLHVLDEADLLVVSVRRRILPENDMEVVRRFVAAGKPVVGIRTASHAFALRDQNSVPAGFAAWPEFDAEVFGGNYHGHLGNGISSTVKFAEAAAAHPALANIPQLSFTQGGSLYETSPLAPGTTVLLTGHAANDVSHPVAWTYTRRDGGRSYYMALGHVDDFKSPAFVQLLRNAIYWAADLPIPSVPSRAAVATKAEGALR